MIEPEEMQKLIGREFPGGSYTIEPWEHNLICDVLLTPSPMTESLIRYTRIKRRGPGWVSPSMSSSLLFMLILTMAECSGSMRRRSVNPYASVGHMSYRAGSLVQNAKRAEKPVSLTWSISALNFGTTTERSLRSR